jgi:flagella basal body P-ring formation protein FlgA
VRVTATGESYPGADVSRVAERALRDALQDRYGRVEIAATRAVEDLILPAGRVTLEAAAPDAAAPAKRMSVWVDIAVDGEHYRSVPVWFAVSAWTRVIRVNRDLEHHHVLQPADLAAATIDVAGLPGPPVTDPALVPGQRLVRPLNEGTVLLEKHVEPAPLVQQGAVVDVFAKAGRVVLRAKGVALSDGDLSQRIVVSNPKSGERFAAVVVGPGHVEAL